MNKYDIIIAGGGTSGVACAYTAGKLGLKTLLVEEKSYLGGTMTSSLVIPAMKTSENAINTDFFNVLYNKLSSVNGAITYCDGNMGWFNPELLKIVLDELLLEAGVDIRLKSQISNIKREKLLGYNVTIQNDNNLFFKQDLLDCIESNYLIDATGDAKICKKLNCKFLSDNFKTQPINLRFIMSGIDSKKFADWIMDFDKNRDVTTSCTIDGYTYFSTAYTWDSNVDWALKPLFKQAIEEGTLKESDSNYFQVFSVAGTPDSVAFNAPRILNKEDNLTEVYIKARAAIIRITQFCKKYLPGFENGYISSIADSLGIRVSNRVEGRYIYKKEDLVNGKKFENPVVISNYPIDVHSDKKDCSKLQKVYQEYQLPIESLIVKDNLFAIGRCISAEFEAQAALRIIPSCFSMGEGLAKYLANIIRQ